MRLKRAVSSFSVRVLHGSTEEYMKNKTPKILAVIVTVAVLLMTLSACIAFPGTSAYDIAVKNGFTGTEAEWLESLKGADGADGQYSGQGASAYEIAVKNGFAGTETEWLASLEGTSSSGSSVASATSKAITSGVAIIVSYRYRYSSTSVRTTGGAGSGVIVKDTGTEAYIVTNYHVVYAEDAINDTEIADTIWVYFYGTLYPSSYENAIKNPSNKLDAVDAVYVGGSLDNDIAVLKLTGDSYAAYKDSGATVADITSSALTSAGDTAIAIGNPKGTGISATSGIVSVDSETITVEIKTNVATYLRVMRIDTAVNSGNSGGGLFDAEGRLIGIVNAKTSDTKIENISYAIPTDVAISVANSIIDNEGTAFDKTATKISVGITVEITDTKAVKKEYKTYQVIAANNADGYEIVEKTAYRTLIVNEITVKEVNASSLASSLGLRVGDVLKSVSVGGKEYPVERLFTVSDALFNARAGQNLVLKVDRNGETKTLTLAEITVGHLYSVN